MMTILMRQLPALSLTLAFFVAGATALAQVVEEKTTTKVGPPAIEKSTTTVSPGGAQTTTTTVAPAAVEKTTTSVGPSGIKSKTKVTPAVVEATTTTTVKPEDYWKSLTRNQKIAWLAGTLQVPTDTVETANEIFLTAEVPGMDPGNLDVTVSGDTVILKADKKISTLQKADDYRRIERSYGILEKTIALPASVNSELCTASLKNGILTLVLPKAPAASSQGKKIIIKSD